ncbi:cyclase family protein [Candidatus Parcubacteria bacterium]|nr:cyclase family protein [Candidatus Parcubacteria bacterium]
MKIYDISIELNNDAIVYPGNAPVKISDYARIPDASSNLSKIEMGSHTGTHIDAPFHVSNDGEKLGKFPLEYMVGPAKVFDFSYLQPGDAIKIEDFEKVAGSLGGILNGDRILVKTSNSERGFGEFYEDFVYLDGDCAEWLASKGIVFFAIDYLSIKQKGSKDNRPHTELLDKNIPIAEGVNLKYVPEGQYQLVFLPLKIAEIDGAPARAILIDENDDKIVG